jgi:AraC-like DNA-binding protein
VDERHDADVWDVARPARPSQVAGVTMAGFRGRGVTAVGYRAIPHPAVTLALEFGAGALMVIDGAGRQQQGSLVAGLGFGSDPVWVRDETFEAVQVRLSPVVGRAVLGVPLGDLDAAVVSLDNLWGRQAARIREQLSHAASWAERFEMIDALLAHRHRVGLERAGSSVDPEVAWAWNRILAGRGQVRVDALASEVGWSRRRLWSRFRSQIGLPPKPAAKLVRFDHAAHQLAAGQDIARVAADSGFTDQPHLHRDVVGFTGATPSVIAGEPWLAVDDFAWPGRRPLVCQ